LENYIPFNSFSANARAILETPGISAIAYEIYKPKIQQPIQLFSKAAKNELQINVIWW
jgi:hypothetical protein